MFKIKEYKMKLKYNHIYNRIALIMLLARLQGE